MQVLRRCRKVRGNGTGQWKPAAEHSAELQPVHKDGEEDPIMYYVEDGEKMMGISYGNTTLDPNVSELKTANGSVRLTNKEFKLTEYLMRNKNILVSTEKIMDAVWDIESEAEINVVWVFISALRKKLELIGSDCKIKAVRGVGYKLTADV